MTTEIVTIEALKSAILTGKDLAIRVAQLITNEQYQVKQQSVDDSSSYYMVETVNLTINGTDIYIRATTNKK